MGNYNPDRPYVIGMQWAPLVADTVLLDTSTEVGYTFQAPEHYSGGGMRRVRLLTSTPPPGQPARKELLVNLYDANRVAGTGPIRKLVVPCTHGEGSTNAGGGGGAASIPDALQNPSDPRHMSLTGPNGFFRLWFGVLAPHVVAALDRRRILDVSVLYAISGPFDAAPGSVTVGLERPSTGVNWVMDDTLTGPPAQTSGVVPRRARLGELNPWWSPTARPTTTSTRLPWRLYGRDNSALPTLGLEALVANSGLMNVRVSTSAGVAPGAVFQLHYVALEVTYCEENRIGGGGLDISGGAVPVDGISAYDIPIVQLRQFGDPVYLDKAGSYALTVGQAHAGQLSVASPVPVRIDRLGTIGSFPSHEGVVLRKTLRAGSVPTVGTVGQLPAIVAFTGDEVPGRAEKGSHPYLAQAIGTLSNRYGPEANGQWIAGEAGEFVWARFYARHLPGTRAPLRLVQLDRNQPTTQLAPRATVSVDDFDRLPELSNGWKQVTLRLEPPVVIPTRGVWTLWGFDSPARDDTPWQILGADQNPVSLSSNPASLAGYGGEEANARIDGKDDLSADFALMLAREMDPVTGLSVTAAVQPLRTVDPHCDRPPRAIATGLHYHRLSWQVLDTAMVAGWGFYEVQRRDDTMPADDWETIAKVVEPRVSAVDDYEARVGVASRYRIRAVHRTGIAGPWSAPVTATIPAPGVTGVGTGAGVLLLTSNHHPDGNLAYVMTFDRRSGEDFTFPEAGQVELRAMFDRDYRTAFRPLERAGVEFTRTVLVNAAAIPPATMDKGFGDLRDLAWDTVPYVCVRDELHNRWLSTLLVPSGSVRRRGTAQHLHLAQLTIIEVTDTPAPLDGGPAACEGLRTEGATEAVTAQLAMPPAFAPLLIEDVFNRVVTGGWGNTPTPGMAWTVQYGPAEDLAVNGTAGTITLARYVNSNPYAETNTAGWTAHGGAVTRSTAQAHQGGASLLLTPSGSAATARIESDLAGGVAARVLWRTTAWVRCPVARQVVPSINWYNAAGTYLSTLNGAPVAVPANTWTFVGLSGYSTDAATASATANFAMTGNPPASHQLYIDEAHIGPEPADKRLVTGPELRDVDLLARVRVDT
ncbi:MAG TPA: hypothetical protein VF755_23025, partial [Catenuloplanes sp.]